ncbi:lysosomal alpha-mannosidase isoform X2 [Tripterygium wilfordii]|uniref:Alpha-mannosidase n=2 Tax=Tripterygium wilfordii TaxID=458696 RepID=A0A7J7CVJ5_TRIWF|nr:lysosomal alpha-mannosidase isoform X2 [Tripterygium wilfordii]
MESLVMVVCCFLWLMGFAGAKYVKYETGAGVVEGKLNVHLVPHSHDDVGWLKTVDEYYVGSKQSIQVACVENVLDSVVEALLRDRNRKFVFAEMAFFQRWWGEQSPERQEQVKKLVQDGRLEFVNGGWCMHDEATCHYIDMIDQTTLGHRMIKEQFKTVPRAGWQIDPFGHSAVQAYMLGAELGFDSVHFARIDHQDRKQRKVDKSLEVIWRGSKTFGSSSQIFANAFPNHYGPPEGFRFEVDTDFEPVQDDDLLFDYNVEKRVKDFRKAAKSQAKLTRTNHIMWTMGGDFEYQYAESWFKQMDKLIHHVNNDSRVNALYSTPSIYTVAKNAAKESWPLKTDDYFPYAEMENDYWTGFFTSRPAFKRYVRMLSGYYLATRQLEFLAGRRSTGHNTFPLGDALGIAQHHDAISGTAKQLTTNDYTKRLAIGASEAEVVSSSALSCLVNKKTRGQCVEPEIKFRQCLLLNISYCPPTEEDIPEGKSLVAVLYNPLGWKRKDTVRIPVTEKNLIVHDILGNTIETQYLDMDEVTRNLRNLYLKAYLGLTAKQTPKHWLLFQVSVPPLGWTTYFISKHSENENVRKGYLSRKSTLPNDTFEIRPGNSKIATFEIGRGNLKMSFSSSTGLLKRMHNSRTGVDMTVDQSYLWYGSSSSGAYVFRPDGSPHPVSASKWKRFQGPLVDEVHQHFSSDTQTYQKKDVHQHFNTWIHQVIRLYRDKEHAEVEYTIGPISTENGIGKEVITRINASMATDKVFYTDSNGRDFLKRVRDSRTDWRLEVDDHVAGNYYPIRGNYYLNINKLGDGARWRRTTGQEVYSPLLLAFTHENSENWKVSHLTKTTTMDPDYRLPLNVALITLQELEDGIVILRLAHLYEAHEDDQYSKLARVILKKMFARKRIKKLTETSLSTNQEKSEMKKLEWKVVGDNGNDPSPVRGGPVNDSTLVVELGPMEIRTFVLEFDYAKQ